MSARSGATIAYAEAVDQDGGLTTLAAVKYCHPNDNYSKSQGRNKARGLLTKLAVHDGALQEKTYVGGNRYFYRAGSITDNLGGIVQAVQEVGGYARL